MGGSFEVPQSNQRGIETKHIPTSSVNLTRPQSNQRGIETPVRDGPQRFQVDASIEPAWD